jgi:NAD(P)-dependent dehydrogenase (short-subunit alcohol dehydrogenase family)
MGLENYDKKRAYCITKLANVMFTRHLAKMLEGTGVTVNTLHPGVVQTEIFRNLGTLSSYVLRLLRLKSFLLLNHLFFQNAS